MNPQTGGILKDYIKIDPNARVSIEFRKTEVGTKAAPSVAIYSSRGPSTSYPFVLKPDVMVSGDLILAAWPSNRAMSALNSKLI